MHTIELVSYMKIEVTYFAMLREQRGVTVEQLESSAVTLGELYGEIADRHGFTLDSTLIRAARNNVFVAMSTALEDGDSVVYMPPVAGG